MEGDQPAPEPRPKPPTRAELVEERDDLRVQVAALTEQVRALSQLVLQMHSAVQQLHAWAQDDQRRPALPTLIIERMTSDRVGKIALGALLALVLAMVADVLLPGQGVTSRVIEVLPAAIHGTPGGTPPGSDPTPPPEGQTP